MRTRVYAPFVGLLLLAMFAIIIGNHGNASARLQTDGTPVGTPADAATPVAGDETPVDNGIVTMVLWYQQNSTGEILQLSPVTSDGFVYTKAKAANETEEGRVVFEEARNEGYPRIRVGPDTYFDAAPTYPGDPESVQRWFYYNDDPTLRPATMVMQITGIRGEYDGWVGTATFISRGTDQGGLLIIAISPPAE
jgi:hypothetical protein